MLGILLCRGSWRRKDEGVVKCMIYEGVGFDML